MKQKLRFFGKIIKYYLIEYPFAKRKKFITRITPTNELKQLLEMLYPINCERAL